MEEISKLKQAFPEARIVELATQGVNLYFETFIVSVYWKRKKYGIDGKWDRYKSIGDLISIVNQRINPPPKVAHIEPQAIQTPNNVQLCIDHIKRKIEYAENNGLSATNIAMLKTLNSELTQYL